ncbi:TetR family transcriptional regulator [Nocardia mangyaensis]|uniref:TetR family transcriptional regulator n=1 Tax=Nocardia mangyaensis TaxID=2213200 RepID=A0A1J0VUV6_9NOCA|nr:TetR/AcrR family transcriptional regulator [Nocardia mangyaensis]APE35829.1 TetR family transcriptional regulator [Nocardia mangyaensis]
MARAEVVRSYRGISAASRRDERRDKLLAAARQIWGDTGLTELTVRRVCTASGLTPRYFYEHFATRDALVLAVAEQAHEELFTTMVEASRAEPGGLRRKLLRALTTYLDAIADDPSIHRILTSDAHSVAGLEELRTRAVAIVTDLVVQYSAEFLDSPANPEIRRQEALFVVGGVNQLVEAWLRDPRQPTTDLAELCTELALALVNRSP